jgi:hypothetical protein
VNGVAGRRIETLTVQRSRFSTNDGKLIAGLPGAPSRSGAHAGSCDIISGVPILAML